MPAGDPPRASSGPAPEMLLETFPETARETSLMATAETGGGTPANTPREAPAETLAETLTGATAEPPQGVPLGTPAEASDETVPETSPDLSVEPPAGSPPKLASVMSAGALAEPLPESPPVPERRRRVILHVGLPKTGTTVLQRAMMEHAQHAAARGVLYPVAGRHPLFADGGHHLLAIACMMERWDELELELPREDVETAWDALKREIATSPCSDILISSEWFALDIHEQAHFDRLAAHLEGFDILVVIVLRDVVDFVNSLYAQRVRDGWAGGFDAFIRLLWEHLDWSALVERWRQQFGEGGVLPLRFEHLCDRGLVETFSTAVLGRVVTPPDAVFPAANLSISHAAAVLMEEINRSELPVADRMALCDLLKQHYDDGRLSGPKPDFVSRDAAMLLRRHCVWP